MPGILGRQLQRADVRLGLERHLRRGRAVSDTHDVTLDAAVLEEQPYAVR
jgi:hypothetical protein